MNKSKVCIFVIRLVIIALSVVLFHITLFGIFLLPKDLPSHIILLILAFCVADYAGYCLVKKKVIPISENSYDMLVEMVQQSLVIRKIHKQKPILIVLIFLGVYLIVGTFSLGVSSSITGEGIADIGSGKTKVSLLLIGTILAPILETLLFQMIPVELLCRITPAVHGNRNHLFPCLVSAIVFSLAHNYSASYMILAFCMGLCLAAVYTIVSTQKGRTWKDGFLWTMIFHMAKNALAFLSAVL